MAIEEIIVRGKRPAVKHANLGGQIEFFFRSGGKDVSRPGLRRFRQFADEAARSQIAGVTRTEFNLGKEKAAQLSKLFDKPMEEIVVKAKRLPKRAPIGFVSAFAGPALFAADVAARIFDELSQQRLDEVGRIATLTDPPKPDTPVATIEPEVIPEIVVTAKRPVPTPPVRIVQDDPFSTGFGDPRVRSTPGRIAAFPTVSVKKPTIPKQNKRPRVPLPALTGQPLALVLPLPGSRAGAATRPVTIPRSQLLNIGGPGQPTQIPGLTGLGAGGVPLPMTSPVRVASGFCPPCPKPKKKRPRTKCYKKLVEERRNPSADKTFKWTRIDCDSGRELRTK